MYPLPVETVEERQAPPVDLGELALWMALAGSTAGDLATTFRGLEAGHPEANPVMRPFAKAGRVPLALAAGAGAVLSAVLSRQLRKRHKSAWWVPLVANTVAHTAATLANRRRMR